VSIRLDRRSGLSGAGPPSPSRAEEANVDATTGETSLADPGCPPVPFPQNGTERDRTLRTARLNVEE
jgi:hypothetical protein